MTTFPIHTLSSAPAASKPALQQLQDGFGFIPNVAGAIANSPVLMKTFAAVFANVHSGSFDEDEIQIVLLTDAVANALPGLSLSAALWRSRIRYRTETFGLSGTVDCRVPRNMRLSRGSPASSSRNYFRIGGDSGGIQKWR
jgi:hypothetical protein